MNFSTNVERRADAARNLLDREGIQVNEEIMGLALDGEREI